jgi:hypothetical protein
MPATSTAEMQGLLAILLARFGTEVTLAEVRATLREIIEAEAYPVSYDLQHVISLVRILYACIEQGTFSRDPASMQLSLVRCVHACIKQGAF